MAEPEEAEAPVDAVIFSPPYAESLFYFGDKRLGFWYEMAERTGRPAWVKAEGKTRRTADERDKGYAVDAVLTSPPFADQISDKQGGPVGIKGHLGVSGRTAREYSADPKNIGNLKQGDIDAILTSPPFENSLDDGGGHGVRRRDTMLGGRGYGRGYGPKSKENIGRLKGGEVDAIVSSPPYSEGEFDTRHGMKGSLSRNLKGRKVWEERAKLPMKKGDNIGTLKHGKVDAVVTSPPYSEGIGHHANGDGAASKTKFTKRMEMQAKYTGQMRSEGNIASLKHPQVPEGVCTCKIDAVLEFPSTAGFGWYSDLFGKDAVAHPAKANLLLLRYLVEEFTEPGDTVLDPMAGTGSTTIMAADLGRNGVAVELEDRFYGWIQDNIRAAKAHGAAGDIRAVKGDARKLTQLLSGVDGVITSPPYGDSTIQDYGSSNKALLEWERKIRKEFRTKGFIIHDGARYTEKEWRAKNHGELKPRGFPELWASIVGQKERQRYNDGNPENIGNLSIVEKANMTEEAFLRFAVAKIDEIITSPPYSNIANQDSRGGVISPYMQGLISKLSGIPVKEFDNNYGRLVDAMRIARAKIPFRYGDSPGNIGNLDHGNVDAVVTSPPYADAKKGGKADDGKMAQRWNAKFAQQGQGWNSWGKNWDTPGRKKGLESMGSGYSEDPANIGNLPAGSVDSVMMSPPYGKSEAFADPAFMQKITAEQSARIREGKVKGHYRRPEAEKEYLERMTAGRVEHPDSISKIEKQETYLEAMLKVYRESYAVLKPGGRMVLILKDFVRNKKIVLLHEHTMKLCEFIGFRLERHLKSRLSTQSFWRVLYLKKHAKDVLGLDELNYEHVLVFVKPESD